VKDLGDRLGYAVDADLGGRRLPCGIGWQVNFERALGFPDATEFTLQQGSRRDGHGVSIRRIRLEDREFDRGRTAVHH
jgi:hypothetical protein